MKHMLSRSQSLRQLTSRSHPRPIGGPEGIAIAPPAYGIDFVDRQRSTKIGTTIQRQDREHSSIYKRPPENRTGLPDQLKARIENFSRFSLDDVRVHYNSDKPAGLHALAYTQGTDIHVAPGQERHLPHEAWHVVQQKQGRVQPRFQLKGEQINDDHGLEHEAAVMGSKALRIQDMSLLPQQRSDRYVQQIIARGGATAPGRKMANDVRERMESAFHADFSDVRIHEGNEAAALDARAYTQGSHIYFQPGEYQPNSSGGRGVLGHELAHVLQQRAGFVPLPCSGDASVDQDEGLEREANVIGQQVAAGKPVGITTNASSLAGTRSSSLAPIQRLPKFLKKMFGLGKYRAGGDHAPVNLHADVEREYEDDDIGYAEAGRMLIREPKRDDEGVDAMITEAFGAGKKSKKVRQLLRNIAHGQGANLDIGVGDAGFDTDRDHFDLARRARELGLDVPERLAELEETINECRRVAAQLRDELVDPLVEQKVALQRDNSLAAEEKKERLAQVDKEWRTAKARARESEEAAAESIGEYRTIVEDMINREVIKDLIQIAKTDVGRNLLAEISQNNKQKVKIRTYHYYKVPDAASGYVNYTPQYFKNRDTVEREEGGAIRRFENLKTINPWQENERSDITLFHELVHAYHYQIGTNIPTDEWISKEQARHEVDNPRWNDFDNKMGGVPREEYATVGLGEFAEDEFTENAYRRALQELGQEVSLRTQYSHIPLENVMRKKPKNAKKGRRQRRIIRNVEH